VLHWLKTVVVSDEEKVACELPGGDQEGERERTVDEASKNNRRHQNRGVCMSLRYEPGGCPLTGQAVSGVKAARAWSAASAGNGGKRALMLRLGYLGKGSERREGARRAAETVRR
jgi:hypothetical protein